MKNERLQILNPEVEEKLKRNFYQHRKMIGRIFFTIIICENSVADYFDISFDKDMVDDSLRHFFPIESSESASRAIGRNF